MRFLILLFLIIGLNAKEIDVDIQANSFQADQTKNIIIFTGNVSMVKGEDTLVCKELTVHTKLDSDTNQTVAKQYIAIGNVSFTIKRPDTLLIGNGDKVNYDIDKQMYIITGNAYLEDKNGSKTLRGEKIYINEATGNTKIDGKKNKPVKFKFKMQSKEGK
ncbi:MAG: lipopolysaccharide transport periplasmic protein LptA [Arcobacteraceae bacterium]|nr:lipopolysaccharide transport periplasmic protein LptA [Arcobacteraceae bacterium]